MKISEKESTYNYIRMYDYKEFLKLDASRKYIKQGDTTEYYIVGLSRKLKQVEVINNLSKTSSRDLLIRFININKDRFKDIKEVVAYKDKENIKSLYVDLVTIDDEEYNLHITYYNDNQVGYSDKNDKHKEAHTPFSIIKMRNDIIHYDPYEDIKDIIEASKEEFITYDKYWELALRKCVVRSSKGEPLEDKSNIYKGFIVTVDEDLNKVEHIIKVRDR